MVAVQVYGNDAAVAFANSQGHFQLNVYKPVILHNVLESVALLADACQSFDDHCAQGIEPNRARIDAHVRVADAGHRADAAHRLRTRRGHRPHGARSEHRRCARRPSPRAPSPRRSSPSGSTRARWRGRTTCRPNRAASDLYSARSERIGSMALGAPAGSQQARTAITLEPMIVDRRASCGSRAGHAVKQSLEDASEQPRAGEPEPDAGGGHASPWPITSQATAAGRGAKREADAQLTRALAHQVRHHAVGAHRGEDQGHAANSTSAVIANRRDASARSTRADIVMTRWIGKSGSCAWTAAATAVRKAAGSAAPCTDHVEHAARPLRVRPIDRDAVVRVEAVLLNTSHHADDPLPRCVLREVAELQSLADGILPRPVPLGSFSSMMTTRSVSAVSCSSNSRPRRSGMRIASK